MGSFHSCNFSRDMHMRVLAEFSIFCLHYCGSQQEPAVECDTRIIIDIMIMSTQSLSSWVGTPHC